MKLRPYQEAAIQAAIEDINKTNKALIVLPTGSGKTHTGLSLARLISGRVLWIAHREELITQPYKACGRVWPGVSRGIVKGSLNQYTEHCVFASVQTISRDNRLQQILSQDWGMIVVDEAHHATSNSYLKILNKLSHVPVLGLTATPERMDKRTIGDIFHKPSYQYHLATAIQQGYLCPVEIARTSINVDLDELRTSAGDYNQAELDTAMAEAGVVKAVCDSVDEYAGSKKTCIFTVSVAQSRAIVQELQARGYAAAHIDGETPNRSKILDAYKHGRVQVVSNCAVLCLDEKTEILTDRGWTNINEISFAHKVANFDKDTGNVSFEMPIEIVKRPRGTHERMVSLETPRRSIRVTEGHRMLHRSRFGTQEWLKSAARDIADTDCCLPVSTVSAPESQHSLDEHQGPSEEKIERMISANAYCIRKKNQNLSLDQSKQIARERAQRRLSLRQKRASELTDSECEFIGFWMGDGARQLLKNGGAEYKLYENKRNHQIVRYVDGLIDKLGLDNIKRDKGKVFHWSLPRGTGGGSQQRNGVYFLEPYLDKSIPRYFWSLDENQFDRFLHGYWMADGNHGSDGQGSKGRETSKRIFSADKRRLERIQAIAVCRGYRATLRSQSNGDDELYTLSYSKRESHQLTKYRLQIEDSWLQEMVWCVKTRTKNLITRRNGTVTFMGNTEGFDEPSIECIIMARPTKSKPLYLQIIGRGLRKHPSKESCLVVDLVGASNHHTMVHAAALVGEDLPAAKTKVKKSKKKGDSNYWAARLVSQIEGVETLEQSQIHWIAADQGKFTCNAGPGGTIVLDGAGDDYSVVVLDGPKGDRLPLTSDPVELELAQGIAEDYIRQCQAVDLTKKSAAWRMKPASDKQLDALKRMKLAYAEGLTSGEASDLIQAKKATSSQFDAATPKQIKYLRYLRIETPTNLSKREASRLINAARFRAAR